MYRVSIILMFLFLVVSCKSSIGVVDFDYSGEPYYDNFYLVDTIKIEEPIVISSEKFGGRYIISRATLEKYDNKREFFSRPDVFVYGDDFHQVLPYKEHTRYAYPKYDECDKFVQDFEIIKGLYVYSFKQDSLTFLLGFINANYYYKTHSGFHVNIPDYREYDYKRNFYKIVFPYCK